MLRLLLLLYLASQAFRSLASNRRHQLFTDLFAMFVFEYLSRVNIIVQYGIPWSTSNFMYRLLYAVLAFGLSSTKLRAFWPILVSSNKRRAGLYCLFKDSMPVSDTRMFLT